MPKISPKSSTNIFQIAEQIIHNKENGYNVLIPNLCNNANLFGRGFVDQISNKYPEVKENYYLLGKNFLSTHPGYVQFIDVNETNSYNRRLIIANMIVKNGVMSKTNKRPLNYAYLVKSMIEIKKFMLRNFNSESKSVILFAKDSTKNTGANFNFINDLISDIWKGIEVDII